MGPGISCQADTVSPVPSYGGLHINKVVCVAGETLFCVCCQTEFAKYTALLPAPITGVRSRIRRFYVKLKLAFVFDGQQREPDPDAKPPLHCPEKTAGVVPQI